LNTTPFESANRNLVTLYGNMIAAYSVNTAIHQLMQEEEAFSKQERRCPGLLRGCIDRTSLG